MDPSGPGVCSGVGLLEEDGGHTGRYNSASIDPLLCALAVPWARADGKSAWQHHGYHQHAPMQEPGLTTTGRSRYCCKDPCVPRLLATEGPSFSCHI